jgi:hypothetical protein
MANRIGRPPKYHTERERRLAKQKSDRDRREREKEEKTRLRKENEKLRGDIQTLKRAIEKAG